MKTVCFVFVVAFAMENFCASAQQCETISFSSIVLFELGLSFQEIRFLIKYFLRLTYYFTNCIFLNKYSLFTLTYCIGLYIVFLTSSFTLTYFYQLKLIVYFFIATSYSTNCSKIVQGLPSKLILKDTRKKLEEEKSCPFPGKQMSMKR